LFAAWRRSPRERERDRTLSDVEFVAVWKTAEIFPNPWGQFVRFLLLAACRRTEASAMAWSEISGDEWTIPKERYKTNTEVTLPLSKAAMKVLAEIPRIKDSEYVFTTDARAPISGFSTFKLKFDIACGVKDWRLHDLRRTSRSLMSRAGVNSDIAERCMGHALPGIRAVYDRHRYLNEMRHAFEQLAAQIKSICGTK
jgi:integrase